MIGRPSKANSMSYLCRYLVLSPTMTTSAAEIRWEPGGAHSGRSISSRASFAQRRFEPPAQFTSFGTGLI